MPRRTIILTSVLVGIIALIGGILGIASRSTSYDATAEVSVVPKTTNVDQSISAVDTLSRGPVTSNFAEAFSSSRIVDEAFRVAGISEAEADLYRRCCGDGPVHAVTNGVDLEFFRPRRDVDGRGCVFVRLRARPARSCTSSAPWGGRR